MRTTKMFQTLTVLAVLFATTVLSYATDLEQYQVRETYEYWETFDDGYKLGTNRPWGTIYLPNDFDFNYDNTDVTTMQVHWGGYLRFNGDINPAEITGFAQYSNMVSWYDNDLVTNGNLQYKITGNKPFRVLTIQHTGVQTRFDNTDNYFEAQVKIYESTNEITVIYGENSGIGRKGLDGALFFSGSNGINEYWVVNPHEPFTGSTSTFNGGTNYNLNSTTRNWIYEGRAWTLTPNPTIANIYPNSETILVRGNKYSGNNRPWFEINRSETQPTVEYRYHIEDDEGNVVYESDSDENDEDVMEWIAIDPQPTGNKTRIYIDHANADWGVWADGSLDLQTDELNIKGGTYYVFVEIRDSETEAVIGTYSNPFTIALEDDLEVVEILYPTEKSRTVYPYAKTTPVEVKLRNLGNRSLTKFEVKCELKHVKSGSTVTLNYTFDSSVPGVDPLGRGEVLFVRNWGPFVPNKVGDWTAKVTTKLLDAAGDDQPENNVFPMVGDEAYTFTVGYDYEGEVVELAGLSQGGEYVNYPIVLGAKLKNNGSIDLADEKMTMKVTDPDNDVVFEKTMTIGNLTYLEYANEQSFYYDDVFFPTKVGTYTVEVNYDVNGDVIPANNVETFTFVVNGGLKGDYDISVNGGDFATIGEAVDALFRRGVDGPVRFFLQDDEYTEGSLTNAAPAIDFSSKILGVDAENTVTFTLEEDDFGKKVEVHLYSFEGVGIRFGQTNKPGNIFAPVNKVDVDDVKNYATSNGHIIFDGMGTVNLILHTSSTSRSVIELANAAQNIRITDCKISDAASLYNCDIPGMRFNSSLGAFNFSEDDHLTTGVLVRNTPPRDKFYNTNYFNLPTLAIKNNVIKNNLIEGFGLGIVATGIGALIDDETGNFYSLYNENNKYCGNTITDVAKAGIFVGFELGSQVKGNTIFDVSGSCSGMTAGIIAGGQKNKSEMYYGYNNIDLTINANEIYNVNAEIAVTGILVEQVETTVELTGKKYVIPYMDENLSIKNNTVWDLRPAEGNTDVCGIFFGTERGNDLTVASNPAFFTTGDFIANNTVVLENYNNIENTGNMVGIAITNSANPQMYNNAIAMLDNYTATPAGQVNAAVYYKSLLPRWNTALISDRNAFDIRNSATDLFRMVQTTGNGEVVNEGFNGEFENLNQWFYWTNQDGNSIVGPFANDFTVLDSKTEDDDEDVLSVLSLRVKANPFPENSILNNRGKDLIDIVEEDIDGDVRGNAEEKYDIGADEFNGTSLKFDLELVRIVAPGVYKAETGKFSNNEYIMTKSPVGMTVRVRNNSSVLVNTPRVHVKIYHETYDGVMDATKNVVMDYTAIIPAIAAHETADVVITDNNNKFEPETYGYWRMLNGTQPFNVPVEFRAMESNVTPLYRIEVSLDDDQLTENNSTEKDVRFYLKHSTIDLMTSAEHLKYDLSTIDPVNQDYTAAQTNLDSLIRVYHTYGWSTEFGPEPENRKLDVDLFDRKEWEPRSIDYTLYRSLVWSDGNDVNLNGEANVLSNYDVINLTDFFKSGTEEYAGRKNFLAASQEFVRNNSDNVFASEFLKEYFRAEVRKVTVASVAGVYETTTPLGEDENGFISYDGFNVEGQANFGPQILFGISATGIHGDADPYPALVSEVEGKSGAFAPAILYVNHVNDRPANGTVAPEADRIAGFFRKNIAYNAIVLNVDWRHFTDPEAIFRAASDFFVNVSPFTPVELTEFNADLTGSGVEITWETESETNVSRYEVEKADVNNGVITAFHNIGIVPSNGTTTTTQYYGPVMDTKIAAGNTYAYRLKMIDIDGSYGYSETVLVNTEIQNGALTLNGINPSPVTTAATLSYTVNNDDNVVIEMVDMSGRLVAVLENEYRTAGNYEVEINASEFTSGSYIVVIKSGNKVITKAINIVK